LKGFHVNGVDDAFGIQSLTAARLHYFFLLYWPKYATSNDFFGPVFLNAAGKLFLLFMELRGNSDLYSKWQGHI